jgi:predicted enzyme related to lactoylglutathione lyase
MLYVKDLESMKRFYGELLGVEPGNRDWTDVWAVFDTGGGRFHLHAVPGEIAAGIEISDPPEMRESEASKLMFAVADVEAERGRLEARGVRIVRRPWQKAGEGFDAVDPEGNVFQICAAK